MARSTPRRELLPDQQWRDAVETLTKRVAQAKRKEQVPFAKELLRTRDCSPPLARLIQGGRGGEVRLKLFLTITMATTKQPYDMVSHPALHWAKMLGVIGKQPERRVADGLKWLHDEGFIILTPRKNLQPTITLLAPQEAGKPSVEHNRPNAVGKPYISLPNELWTNGWIVDLPATSLALLMVIRDVQQGKDLPRYVSRLDRQQYGLSADTWTRGAKDLKERGLLEIERVPLYGQYDPHRMRNLYRVHTDRLKTPSRQL